MQYYTLNKILYIIHYIYFILYIIHYIFCYIGYGDNRLTVFPYIFCICFLHLFLIRNWQILKANAPAPTC